MASISTSTSTSLTWKDHFTKLAIETSHQGSSLSSIRNASLHFSTQEMLWFLVSDMSLMLLVDDKSKSLLVFHHFKSFTCIFSKQESKLVAVAGINHMAMPVVLNTTFIKNYSQFIPTFDSFKNQFITSEFPVSTKIQNLSTDSIQQHKTILSPPKRPFYMQELINDSICQFITSPIRTWIHPTTTPFNDKW